MDEHRRLVKSWRPDVYPSVDVFLPVCGEPVDVLRNTWKYVAEMSEHYQGTVTPYVLARSAFEYEDQIPESWITASGLTVFTRMP